MKVDFARMLDATRAEEFARDPRPGWSGPALLFGAAFCDLHGLPREADVVAAGVPFDGTSSSRPGASEGPAAIRQASLVFSSYLDSLGHHEMCDMRTGEVFHYRGQNVLDAGDLHVYPTDTVKTFRAVASEVRDLAAHPATLVLLGGDHSITFPAFAGWRAAQLAATPTERLGYIQVDNHFDFGETSALHGPLYHGSNARRISELPGLAPERIAFVGQSAVTRNVQLEALKADGYHLVAALEILALGADAALSGLVAAFELACDTVYLSIDIDVLDCSVAPGTGAVTLGGLLGGSLLDVLAVLSRLPIGAIDIAEVSPRYDPSGRTAQIAARMLFEFIFRDRRAADPTAEAPR